MKSCPDLLQSKQRIERKVREALRCRVSKQKRTNKSNGGLLDIISVIWDSTHGK